MKHSESIGKYVTNSKVWKMFSVFQKVIKRNPSNHRQYDQVKFLGTTERRA